MLPQRRKSAEEIAKLRESLGIPGEAGGEAGPAVSQVSAPLPPLSFTPPSTPAAAAPPPAPKQPDPVAELGPAKQLVLGDEQPAETLGRPAANSAKLVRSLRKSEQSLPSAKSAPSPAALAGGASIPQRRHSDRELMEMRRIQAAPPDRSISHLRHLAVPWPLVGLGYALPLLGALSAWLAGWMPTLTPLDFPAQWMADLSRQPWLGKAGFGLLAALCGLGLLFSASVAWKKPRSRHHAGFITIISVLILAFGIIHHFSPTYGP